MPFESSSPSPHQHSKGVALFFSLLWHAIAFLIVIIVLLVIVPKFDAMFQEFGLKLPAATAVIFNLSRLLLRYGLLMIPLGLILDVGILSLLSLTDGIPRAFRHIWFAGVLLLAGGILLLVAIGVLLPLIGLIQGLR